MSYRWESPLAWLNDKLPQVEDHLLLSYLNVLITDLDPDMLESDYRTEMQETGYFEPDEESGDFERTGDLPAQEWFRLYVQDLSSAQQRREIIAIASSLDSDRLQDIFQSEMDQDGYFAIVPRDLA
jgi:hypothetical protein